MKLQMKPWVIPTITGISAFASGFGLGWLILSQRFKHDEEKIMLLFEELKNKNDEIESLNVQLGFKTEESLSDLNSKIQQLNRVIGKLETGGKELLIQSKEESSEKRVIDHHPSNGKITLMPVANKNDDSLVVNVFEVDDDDDWDYDVEVPLRTMEKPYVIHVDEFFGNEEEYDHCSLMYYAGDNILCDEHDVPIYDPERLVGKLEFGKGSRDPNIVYIRNDHNRAEYEVLYDPGYFQQEVLGEVVDKNLKHSRPVPKFKLE